MQGEISEDYAARVLQVDCAVRLLCQVQVPEAQEGAGGFMSPERLCCEPLWTAHAAKTFWRAYREPRSQFGGSADIRERLLSAVQFLLDAQHEDGTIDVYAAGDLHSIGATAEAASALCTIYSEAQTAAESAAPTGELLLGLETILRGCARPLIERPADEHDRWAVTVALFELNAVLPDANLTACASRYLEAGAGMHADGVLPGRSAAQTLLLCERLARVAELSGEPAYFHIIGIALDFLLHTLHENGEIVYQFSLDPESMTSRARLTGARLWVAAAGRLKNGVFAHVADQIASREQQTLEEAARKNQADSDNWSPTCRIDDPRVTGSQSSPVQALCRRGELLDYREIEPAVIARQPLPTVYTKTYATSRIVRSRDGKRSATLMAMQPNLLTLHNRGVVLEGLRLMYNLNGWKAVDPNSFETYGEYLCRFRHAGAVQGPKGFENAVAFDITSEVRAEAVSLVVEVSGMPRVPLQIEMAWRAEGVLATGDGRRCDLSRQQAVILASGPLSVTGRSDRIAVTGLPPIAHRYFDDTLPWFPHADIVRVICPFFAPATVRLEFALE